MILITMDANLVFAIVKNSIHVKNKFIKELSEPREHSKYFLILKKFNFKKLSSKK